MNGYHGVARSLYCLPFSSHQSSAGRIACCNPAELSQTQNFIQQDKDTLFEQQLITAQHAQSQLRPGYKWDQFLPLPEPAASKSAFGKRLTDLLPAWLLNTRHKAVAQEVLEPADNDDTQPVALNNATWVPVLPPAIAWMMHDAEGRMQKSGVNLPKAQLLAKLTSVSYCARNNIKAWNCTR